MIELLAPAKDKICAKAAIDFGADAVYIGANDFGARKNVPNSIDDIKFVVDYAHKFNVKVYVTLNTILSDTEIPLARKLIKKLDEIGVDAVIIQDMGLLDVPLTPALSHKGRGCINFHASTQCDNRTPEKVKFLQDVGFSRVILARELSIEQIKEIREQTEVELEAFVHGALCVSYSGQCYLSYLIGGRSANRGECAQPCRKKYSLVDEDGNVIARDKHLLSLKDFNASEHIKALADAGITSFKIEGRLKDENYVKNVVAYYRKLIDSLGLQKTSSGKVLIDFEPKLEKSFNRGFTDYFLKSRSDCYSFESPKSKGEFIGKISKICKNYFETEYFDAALKLNPQDGLCFYSNDTISGCLVNKSEIDKKTQRIYPNKMEGLIVGTKIYRNFDFEFEKQLKNSKSSRKIAVDIEFYLDKVAATDEDGNCVQIPYQFEELAQNSEKMSLNIVNQLKKSGESDFLVGNIRILTKKIPFIPVSKLNELRRHLLEKLMDERLKNYKCVCGKRDEKSSEALQYPQDAVDYQGNVCNDFAKCFYKKHGCKVLENAIEGSSIFKKQGRKAMTTKHCLRYAFNMCKKDKNTINVDKKLFLVDEKNKKYELKFVCKNCEMEIYF